MDEILRKYGYRNDLHAQEWRKRNWVIRFGLTEVEAFNNPRLNTPGWYYKEAINTVDLENLLNEIEQIDK
jgi:hypothetical protein